jgi:glycosyltransferase involved in cell wall biosynthesis
MRRRLAPPAGGNDPASRGGPLVVVDADVLGRRRTGDESYVENLLRELAGLATDIRIAGVTRDPAHLPQGIEAIPLPARSQAIRVFWRLPRALRHVRPALAHFQYVIPPGYRGASAITVHDISFEDFPAFFATHDRIALRTLVPRSVRRAALVLTVSSWTRDRILERYGVPESRVVVTPNGVDPVFRPEGPRAGGAPYILFVGAIQPRKDPAAAIGALAQIGDGLRLVMAGPDKIGGDDVRRLVVERGLADRVEFRGYVTKSELAALYRGAECLLFPSRYEGFGLPVLEAMACGIPVVATTAGAIPEVAGDAAVLVAPADPPALADGVRLALSDRDRLRAAGLIRAASFTWRETARRTLAAYRRAIGA